MKMSVCIRSSKVEGKMLPLSTIQMEAYGTILPCQGAKWYVGERLLHWRSVMALAAGRCLVIERNG